ncbi:unnamed protein product [Peronospora belbahrii]|uniref:Uncharacterized protein n=1 Tax=Peronospora belbahrii TaxID=622444 RepID=A0ABN8CZR2_9STRA|nr:unnamed protein product [Peronospora belbahrii]
MKRDYHIYQTYLSASTTTHNSGSRRQRVSLTAFLHAENKSPGHGNRFNRQKSRRDAPFCKIPSNSAPSI